MTHHYKSVLFFVLLTIGAVPGQSENRFIRQAIAPLSSTASPLSDGKRPLYQSFNPHQIQGSIEEKYQINKNSIIRTHDSRALGAKYLNETDLASNEDCLRWCWNTTNCNLAVFEEKTRGSCYIFDCGPIDDFKCRFTDHSYYTSSILQVNRNSYLLSEWKSQANQESELTGLKDKQPLKTLDTSAYFKNIAPQSDTAIKVAPTAPTPKISKCRHFQFECRNNSECIAIYNVCDGIAQCQDGSDEAVELECHKSRLNALGKAPSADSETVTRPIDIAKAAGVQKAVPGQANAYAGPSSLYNAKIQSDSISSEQAKLSYPSSYLNYNYARTPNNEKAGVEDNMLYNRAQLSSDYSGPNGGAYNGLSSWNQYALPGDVFKTDGKVNGYMPDPEQYNAPLKEPAYWPSFNYQLNQQNSELQRSSHPQQSDLSPYGNLPLSISESRARELPTQARQQSSLSQQPSIYNRFFGNAAFIPKTDISPNVTANASVPSLNADRKLQNSSQASDNYSHLQNSQKQQSYVAPRVVAISHLRDSSPQNGRETNSAVIALTLGLFVTCILVVLVGCRMKSFKKRIARRGRSLTHDADYLVNGLYL